MKQKRATIISSGCQSFVTHVFPVCRRMNPESSSLIPRFSLVDLLALSFCFALGIGYVEALNLFRANLLKRELPTLVEYEKSLEGLATQATNHPHSFSIQQWPVNADLPERFIFGIFIGCILMYAYSLRHGCPHPIELLIARLGPIFHLLLTIGLPIRGLCSLNTLSTSNIDFLIPGTGFSIIHFLAQIIVVVKGICTKAIGIGDLLALLMLWGISWIMTSKFYSADPYYF